MTSGAGRSLERGGRPAPNRSQASVEPRAAMPRKTPSARRGRTTALVLAAAAVAVLGAGSLFGGVLGELRPEAAPASASPRLELDAALPLGGTAATVRRLERAVRVDPRDADRLGELGLAY